MKLRNTFGIQTLLFTLVASTFVACGGVETASDDSIETSESALTTRTFDPTRTTYEGYIDSDPIAIDLGGTGGTGGSGGTLGGLAATFECAGGTGACNTTTFGQTCTQNGGTSSTANCTQSSGLCDTCDCGNNTSCNNAVATQPGAVEQRK